MIGPNFRTAPHADTAVMSKALIAMSGGVDSSVAAYLAKSRGLDCIGVTMKLFHNEDICVSSARTCCSLEDSQDARSVAVRLGIPYYVFNFTEDFSHEVIDRFVSAYENGATPNPCIDCNRRLKFGRLFRRAEEIGCDIIVTGHYARVEQKDGRFILKKAVDEAKDQSYVLYGMTQEQLKHTFFPCGELNKSEIRSIAREQGFLNAEKPDSQDLCFVPDGDYARFIRSYTGKSYPGGDFVTSKGKVLGRHNGIINYTVGQRRGLGVSSDKPLYVCQIDAQKNTVVLGNEDEALCSELYAGDFNWIAFERPPQKLRAKVKIRYRQKEQWATVTPVGDAEAYIRFDIPQRASAKGQAAVVYEDDTVLGGGTIS